MWHVTSLSLDTYFPDLLFTYTKKHFYFPAYICAVETFLIHIFMPEKSYIPIFVIYEFSTGRG